MAVGETVAIARSKARYPSCHILAGAETLCKIPRERLCPAQQIPAGELPDLADLCRRCARAHARQDQG